MIALLERAGLLGRDDLVVGVEHGEEGIADALLQVVLAQGLLAPVSST